MSKVTGEIWNNPNLLESSKRGVYVAMKEIPLTQGKVALVDDDDYLELSRFKWYATKHSNSFYAARNLSRNKRIGPAHEYMHRRIIGFPVGVDHIDGDGLNNQKSNLRPATQRENLQNLHIQKTSRFPGVRRDKASNKWRADIRINGKRKFLGNFESEEDAFMCYKRAVENLGEVCISP
jgi:hypothetical protein